MTRETVYEELESHVPFEWLTNFSSLARYLNPETLFPSSQYNQKLQVLHVGCGSSTLGELLLQSFPRYSHVVNVDNDVETLGGMKNRWKLLTEKYMEVNDATADDLPFSGTLHYSYMNFQQTCSDNDDHLELDPLPIQQYDLVLEKSTLDCLLCSDDGAAGLLCAVYKHLKAGGVYFLISFHHVDFIMQLLDECPGTDWTIERFVVERKVDSPNTVKKNEATLYNDVECMFQAGKEAELDTDRNRSVKEKDDCSPWQSGSFVPDEDYGKTVNCFICRRNGGDQEILSLDLLDFEAVRKHIHAANDEYYKKNNPMVTHVRVEELKTKFHQEILKRQRDGKNCDSILPLECCYKLLFTEGEKEHLTYAFFLEDYEAYLKDYQNDGSAKQTGMTFEGSVKFLEAMQ
jgi:hypothetical protein